MIQTPFIPFGDAPEDAVHEAVRLRQDGGDADPAAVFTESKAVSFQPDAACHFRIRAAERHLVPVHIATISKIQQRAAVPASRIMAFFLPALKIRLFG